MRLRPVLWVVYWGSANGREWHRVERCEVLIRLLSQHIYCLIVVIVVTRTMIHDTIYDRKHVIVYIQRLSLQCSMLMHSDILYAYKAAPVLGSNNEVRYLT
jgi:hypothetical protein